MFTENLPALLILFSVFPVLLMQQIFENTATCEYFNYTIAEKEHQKLEVENKLWNITGIGRNSAIRVILSPCGDPLPPTAGCGPGAVVCILNNKNRRKSILNAGKYFEYVVDEDKGKTILRSIDGHPCSQEENYTVIVEFDCSPHLKTTPTYLYKDDCEVRIGMMKSTCTPGCTTRIDGNLVDLRPLQLLGSITVQEPSTRRSFVLSFCNVAKECGISDSTACETTVGSVVAIADLHWHRVTYDPFTNNLVVKSHFGNNKRIRKDTEISIKCNWNVKGIANLKYKVPAIQGKRHYKFEGESSLACIKLPMNCVIKHSYENYWVYNLTSLNKRNENWKVGNVTLGNMYINMCGPLHISQPNPNNCSDKYSQVCYVDGGRQYVNLGSIPIEFHVTSEDTVKGKFVDGDVCAINRNLTYSTEVEFSCSHTEMGPILNVVDNCTYKIKWETPSACSKQFVTSDDCLLSDVTGNLNLRSFHKTSDRIYNFTPTSYLRYNLCGPLNKPCSRTEDVSICYVNSGQEYIAGFSTKLLTRDNTLLTLNLKGDKCNSRTRMTAVYFHCHPSAPTEGNIRINMVKDNCLFEINIDTPLACVLPTFTECKVYNDNFIFNLTPLSLNNSNYLVRDSNSNVNYILNVCHSVINFEDFLCPPGTGACMNNLTEPHMRHKYLSMGNVNNKSVPAIENGDLVIRYSAGSYCAEADTLKRSTVIRFQCSNHEIKIIVFVSIDFSNIHKILHIETKDGELYKFSLCESNYTHCTSNGTDCETIESAVQLLSSDIDPYLLYPLKNQCTDTNTQANKLHIYLKCGNQLPQGSEYFNFTGISNCTFYINLLSNLACSSKESALPLPVPTKSDLKIIKEHSFQNDGVTYDHEIHHHTNLSIIHDNAAPSNISNPIITRSIDNSTSSEIGKPLLLHPLKTLKQNGCVIKSRETSSNLNLQHIKPIYVKSSTGVNYAVTLNGPSTTCGGYICKNNLQIVSETDECPAIQFNNTYSVIKLLYNSNEVCDNDRVYHSEIWLKCNSTVEQPSIFREEKCNVVIQYPLQDACSLLRSTEVYSSTNAEIPIYSLVGLCIIAILAIGGFFVFKKYTPQICSQSCYQSIPGDTEDIVQFKMKEM